LDIYSCMCHLRTKTWHTRQTLVENKTKRSENYPRNCVPVLQGNFSDASLLFLSPQQPAPEILEGG